MLHFYVHFNLIGMKNVSMVVVFLLCVVEASAQKVVRTYWGFDRIKEEYQVNSVGEKNGYYRFYDDMGIFLAEEHFVNGQKHGESKKWFNEEGTRLLLSIEKWNNGELLISDEWGYVLIENTGNDPYIKSGKNTKEYKKVILERRPYLYMQRYHRIYKNDIQVDGWAIQEERIRGQEHRIVKASLNNGCRPDGACDVYLSDGKAVQYEYLDVITTTEPAKTEVKVDSVAQYAIDIKKIREENSTLQQKCALADASVASLQKEVVATQANLQEIKTLLSESQMSYKDLQKKFDAQIVAFEKLSLAHDEQLKRIAEEQSLKDMITTSALNETVVIEDIKGYVDNVIALGKLGFVVLPYADWENLIAVKKQLEEDKKIAREMNKMLETGMDPLLVIKTLKKQ